jgi:hypothetical protein
MNILALEDTTEYFEFPAITNKNMAGERVCETLAA